ncbi:transcription initiation factor TFIID subunit 9 [Nilaparvata lugens]|uniref:transcription initiation factor TFIID subunit 9 n=1 Tax=Nilaparvata lugens TaxID=108931 RepID=UPI00193CFF19|nr:transcription initiation factor TFIID subunit 9 [Nilaparvata lugens]
MMGKTQSNKTMPSQRVITSMLKEMGITDYEPRVINQLLEFIYRYVSCVLDDARVYANHAKKKTIDLEDVKLATTLQLDRVFTSPPSRDMLLELARAKNSTPLPVVKPHCGIRLPPDRYCLNSCNYKLKNTGTTSTKKPTKFGQPMMAGGFSGGAGGSGSMKMSSKTTSVNVVKRSGNITTIPRTQSITTPKNVIKFSTTGAQKVQVKPKIQISAGPSTSSQQVEVARLAQTVKMEFEDNPMKRKREDESQFDDFNQGV